MSYRDKLDKIGPRKLLACDGGGGIRGIISIEILTRVESELRKSSGNPKHDESKFVTLLVLV
jgi:hypothetical protein